MPDNNIYIFSGESYMIRDSLKKLKTSIGVEYEDLNVTEYKSMPGVDELKDACASVPFLSPVRMIIVRDCNVLTASGNAEEAKKLAANLDRLPDTTVLVLCTAEAADKRKTLYKRVHEIGIVREFAVPTPALCASFVREHAKMHGAQMSASVAEALVSLVGCDYFTLENEAVKLAVFSGFGEITAAHVAACASKSLEYNVFEIHRLFVNRQPTQAQALLDELLEEERPEMLIGLFARKLRDMYKIKTMSDAGFGQGKMASSLNMKGFIVQMLVKECARFSQDELREAQTLLADLDYGIKSGHMDAALAIPETLVKIYKL